MLIEKNVSKFIVFIDSFNEARFHGKICLQYKFRPGYNVFLVAAKNSEQYALVEKNQSIINIVVKPSQVIGEQLFYETCIKLSQNGRQWPT